jgi:hypothetical protein
MLAARRGGCACSQEERSYEVLGWGAYDATGWGPGCWANMNWVWWEDLGAHTNLGSVVGALVELDF